MSARRARRRSSSRRRDGIGSWAVGGGSRGVSCDVDRSRGAAAAATAEGSKGKRGVEGRGAAAGADKRAESAFSWGSVKSETLIWSWNWRRAMMRDEVRWLMPWNASNAIWQARYSGQLIVETDESRCVP